MQTLRAFAIASLVAALAPPCLAQEQAATSGHLDTIYVGGPVRLAPMIRDDSTESIVTIPDSSAPNGERVFAHLSQRQTRVGPAHEELFRVSRFTSRSGEVLDSIMTGAADLVPHWGASHQPSKVMHLRFGGARVRGDVTPTGRATQRIDQTMHVAPFNSSDVSLVLGALPLSPGYRALLATYEYESGGLRLDTVTVIGRERITVQARTHDAWVVRLSRGGSSAMTDWLDGDSHALVKEEYSTGSAWTMRIVRVPAR